MKGDTPEYNLAVPLYMINALPVGLVGLSLVALFAAAMSSLDSVLNSLSATTMEDFVRRYYRGQWSPRRELLVSRFLTALWGGITLLMAFFVGDIAPTVLEAINKVGSLANGPILGVFALGLLTQRVRGWQAIAGLLAGVLLNAGCWLYLPSVSWLWWNVFGFVLTVSLALSLSYLRPSGVSREPSAAGVGQRLLARELLSREASVNWYRASGLLLVWFGLLLALLAWLGAR